MSLVIHAVFDFLTFLLFCLIIGTLLLNASDSLSKINCKQFEDWFLVNKCRPNPHDLKHLESAR